MNFTSIEMETSLTALCLLSIEIGKGIEMTVVIETIEIKVSTAW